MCILMETNYKSKIKKETQIKKYNEKNNINSPVILTLAEKEKINPICKNVYSSFTTFEDKIDETFKKNGIDFLSTNYNLEKEIIKQLKKAVSPSNITPENDFYSYINERWLKSYNVDENLKYIVQIDNFRLVQDKVYKELLEIVINQIKKPDHFSQNLKNFFLSTSKSETKKGTILKHFEDYLKYLNTVLKNPDGLWSLLGDLNRNEIISWSVPIVWTLNPDEKQPDTYRCFLGGPKVTLVDLTIYFDDGTNIEYKKNYKKEYYKYLNKVFEYFFGKNHKYNVKDVFDVETKIVNAFVCESIPVNNDESYFKVTKDEAIKKLGLDWEALSKALGFKNVPEFFITTDINYILCITKLLKEEWNTTKWKTYWVFIFIKQIMRFTSDGGTIFYEFNGKFVKGMEAEVDWHLYRIFPLGFAYNTFLTERYIELYKNDEAINYVKIMAEDLKTVFIRIIKRNTWLDPKTKEKALKKLHFFKLQIGYPTKLREDPNISFRFNDIWYNLVKVANWRVDKAIELEGKGLIDIPVIDWSEIPPKFISTQVYVVNASYTPTENGIYIPLGYIQKPFVDLNERGIEYNLANIGFTLAHEMSHSLDDWGSQYDEFGKLKNWWTAKDKKKFNEIQKNVIKQYEVFASYDKIKFDAATTIGEDLADISGLTICTEYLRDFQLKNENILPIQELSFKTFFVYFAFQQRQQINKRAIEAQLKTNPHPLNKYRCNVPLSRILVFRTIFNIKKNDKMWWYSTNKIWED